MQTLWRTVWRLLKNIKIELSCDLAISLLDIDLISRGNYNSKRYRHPKFNVALFTVSKTWEQPKCPQMNGGGFFFLKEIMPFAATCMDLEIIILELSQTEKDNYHMIQLMWDLFILFTGFSRQDYWSGLPFPSWSPTQWTWIWISSGNWWWTGKPGMLQSMGSQSQAQLSDWTDWCGI